MPYLFFANAGTLLSLITLKSSGSNRFSLMPSMNSPPAISTRSHSDWPEAICTLRPARVEFTPSDTAMPVFCRNGASRYFSTESP